MPNETYNNLEIIGDPIEINNYFLLHKMPIEDSDTEFFWDFSKSVPVSDESMEEKEWGTSRGLVYVQQNRAIINTPWRPCDKWFKSMVTKFPKLTFILKYSDEYREEFYGWIVASNGTVIAEEEVCLHRDEEHGGIDLYKQV